MNQDIYVQHILSASPAVVRMIYLVIYLLLTNRSFSTFSQRGEELCKMHCLYLYMNLSYSISCISSTKLWAWPVVIDATEMRRIK